ncbi:MAG: hypothetical protein R2726_23300 [Acidimicrobiales bacterium]
MIRRVLAIAALLLTAFAGLAPVAEAQYVPGQCGFTTQPSTVTPGEQVTFIGTGATPGETLTFTVDGVTIATGTANPDGTFSIVGTVPATLAPGQYTVVTTCSGVEISNILTVVASTSGIIRARPAPPAPPARQGRCPRPVPTRCCCSASPWPSWPPVA